MDHKSIFDEMEYLDMQGLLDAIEYYYGISLKTTHSTQEKVNISLILYSLRTRLQKVKHGALIKQQPIENEIKNESIPPRREPVSAPKSSTIKPRRRKTTRLNNASLSPKPGRKVTIKGISPPICGSCSPT